MIDELSASQHIQCLRSGLKYRYLLPLIMVEYCLQGVRHVVKGVFSVLLWTEWSYQDYLIPSCCRLEGEMERGMGGWMAERKDGGMEGGRGRV